MKRNSAKKLNIRKAVRFAILLNALQVVTMLGVIAYVVLTDSDHQRGIELSVLLRGLLIVGLGAVLDIREARNAERIAEQAAMLEDAYSQLESLNGTLRRQRHDFSNHLQVVFSLLELQDYDEAMRYVESVYGDIVRAGSALKTSIPAVNALIAAKRADCEGHGIQLTLTIRSGWQGMPVPGWELCRVLGNLIDNARDALLEGGTQSPTVNLLIDETPDDFRFSVSNNGPAIDETHMSAIFQMGFTTKRDGHGAGLAIVREILEAHGGSITASSGAELTTFSGSIPRDAKND